MFLYFVIAGMFIVSLLIPALYQVFVVGNGVYSVWDDTVWGGFLGSLWWYIWWNRNINSSIIYYL